MSVTPYSDKKMRFFNLVTVVLAVTTIRRVNAADAYDVCSAGLTSQENPFTESDRSLTIFLDMKFQCDGALTNVEFFSERSDGTIFYVDVWRSGSGANQYSLVGSIRLTAVSFGRQSVDIDVDKRFRVQQGDMIGIHYESGGDGVVIPYFTPNRPGPFSQDQYSDIVTIGNYNKQILATLQSNQFMAILPVQPRARIPALIATVSPGKVLFSCNFTDTMCDMETIPDPVGFKWVNGQAYRVRLSPEQTAIDNTEKSSLGYMAYTTSAANVRSGTTSLLRRDLTCPNSATNECCLSFYVILYGTALINVKIRRQIDQLPETLGVVVGQTSGNMWPQIYKTFSATGSFDLIFEAERGTQGDSSAALDDIVLSEGRCPTVDDSATTCGNYSCSFDDSLCGFTRISQQNTFDWSWQTGASPSRPSNTGPNSGLLERGSYLLASSYGRVPNDRAQIASRPLAISCLRSRVICYTVSFYVHMYGPREGRLNIYANYNAQQKLLWTTSGDHGDGWIFIETDQQPITDLPFSVQSIRVVFEAIIGGSQFSDIAIDQVQVNFQACKSVETACVAGPESVASAPRQNIRPSNLLTVCDSVTFPCGGRIRAWEVYASYAPSTVFAAAFRQIAGGNRYRQIGFNVIKLSSAGQQSIKIDDADQFVVQPGDVMGFYYDSRFTRGILAFAENNSTAQAYQCWEAPVWKADVEQLMTTETYIDMSAVDGSVVKRRHFIKAYVLGTQSCGVVPDIPNAVAQPSFTGRTSVVGDAVVYSCLPGFNTEGPTTVTCTFAATWSELPVCVATPICEAGPPNIAPGPVYFTPADHGNYLQICATNFVRCDGLISAWQFYSIRNDNATVYLTAWRKVFGTNYQLVGKTAAKASRIGRILIELPTNDDRIPVQSGDVLGLMYDSTQSQAVVSIATEDSLMGFSRDDLHQCYVQAFFNDDVRNRMAIDGSVHMDDVLERRIFALKASIDSGNRCQPPPTISYATIQSRSFDEPASAQVGDKVVYSCNRGYTMIGGDTITCLSSGRWTASPQCRALPACTVGPVNVSPDPSTLGDPGTSLMLCPTTRITCPGVIQEWHYYALYGTGAAVYLSVWRKLSETKFQLVGSNMVRPSQVGKMTFEVPDFDQITVQPGDIVGVFYEVETQSGEISYSNEAYPGGLSSSVFYDQQCLIAPLYKNDIYRQMAANSYVSVQPDRIDQRVASLHAVVRFVTTTDGSIPIYSVRHRRALPFRSAIGTCGPAPSVLNANAEVSFDSYQSAPGDYVIYTCSPGFAMTGNATARCNPSGRWTELPFCAELPRCTLGSYSIPELPTGLAKPGNWLNICLKQTLTCSGQISRWQLLSLGEAIVYASVWRRVGENEFTLVGYNRLNVSRAGQLTIFVEPEDRIFVRAGDVLGIFYDDPEAVGAVPYADPQNLGSVPLSNLDSCLSSPLYLPEVTHQMSVSRYVRFTPGTKPFSRRFMLKAFVKDDQGCGPVPSVSNAQSEHQIWNRSSQFGDVAVFHCVSGYSMVGNAAITCSQTEGRWSDAPKCIEKPLCTVGPKHFSASLNNGDLSTSFVMCPTLSFSCAGEVAEWEIFSVRDDGATGYVSVWRKVNVGFQLVGYNRLTANRLGIVRLAIRPSERIQVQAGDFLALFYDDQTVPAIIPYATAGQLGGFTRNSLVDCNLANVYQSELLPFALPNTRTFQVSGQLSRRLPAIRAFVYGTGGCGPLPTLENGEVYMSTNDVDNVSVVNDYAKFQCNSGFVLYGPEIVSCLASGRWSAMPVCRSPEACTAGPRTIRGPSQGLVVDTNQMTLCPAAVFRCPGVVDVWEYFNVLGGANTVYLSVWRRRSMNEFVLVGAHLVASVDSGHNIFLPPTKERIVVETGDFIGFFYELETSAGLMTYADGTHLGGASPVELMTDCITAPFYKAQIYQQMSIRGSVLIENGAKFNRLHSLRAYVKSESVCGSIPSVDFATSLYPVAGRPIRVNDTVEYTCDVNRFLIGQANITCTSDNGWTQEPACIDMPTCYAGSNLNPLRKEDFASNATTTNLTICPTETFSCLGDVFGWEVYSLVDDNSPIFVGVFRPGVDGDNKTFEVVGYMRGSATRIGRVFVEASPTISTRKPIRVRPGDFIGVFYDYRWSVPTVATVNPIEAVNISACPVVNVSTTTTMYPVIMPETTTVDWMKLRKTNASAIPRPCSVNDTHIRAGSEIITREEFDALVQELEERFSGDELVNCVTAQVYRSSIDNVLSSGINALLSLPQSVVTRRLLRVRAFVKGVPACPKPPTIRNGVLVPSYTRLTAEPGDTVVLRCASGLRIRGNPVLSCLSSGKWSSPLPGCEPIPTPAPRCLRSALPTDQDIPKLLVMPMFVGNQAEPGDAAEFACADLYYLIGPSNTTCQPNGSWSEAPTCSPTRPPTVCVSQPPNINFAVVVETTLDNPNSRKPAAAAGVEGDIVIYRCRPGYVMRGNSTVRCLASSTWSKPPVCVIEVGSCGDVPNISNGRPLPSFYFRPSRIGDIVYYSCFNGFRLFGNATVTCQSSKTWSALPNCQRAETKPCGDPPQLRNGYVVSMSYPSSRSGGAAANDSIQYKCARNFQLLGNNRVTCFSNGSWSELPTCSPIQQPVQTLAGVDQPFKKPRNSCGASPTIPNSIIATPSFSGTASVGGDSVTYACKPGFSLVGPASIYCTVDLVWSDKPTCKPNVLSKRSRRSAGSNVETTTPWRGINHGVATTCGYPPAVQHAEPTASYTTDIRMLHKSAPFDTVVFRCTKGHLVGTAVIYCREDGSWSGRPSCVIAKPTLRNGRVLADDPALPPSLPNNSSFNANFSKTCGAPPSVDKAFARPSFTGSASTVGDSVVYQCEKGYTLDGYPVVYCLDANWWSPTPSCREETFPLPLHHHHHNQLVPPVPPPGLTDDDVSYSKLTQPQENYGPQHPGHHHGGGYPYGSWALPLMPVMVSRFFPPASLTFGCGLPPARPRTVLLTPAKPALPGDAALYSCDYGYQMIGEPFIQCQCSQPMQGSCQWVPVAPFCSPTGGKDGSSTTSTTTTTTTSPAICNYIPQIENGHCNVSSDLDYAYVGERAICVCDESFEIAGARDIYCQRNKEWTPPPICVLTTTTSTTTTPSTPLKDECEDEETTTTTTPEPTTTQSSCLPAPVCQQAFMPCCGGAMQGNCGPAPFISGAVCLTPFTTQTSPVGAQASYYCQTSGQVVMSTCQTTAIGCQWTTPTCPSGPSMMLAPGQGAQAFMFRPDTPIMFGRRRRDLSATVSKLASKLMSNTTCGLPPKVHFAVGVLSWGGRPSRPKDSVVFRCIRGELRGPIAAFCREDGRWTNAPTCSVELSSHSQSGTKSRAAVKQGIGRLAGEVGTCPDAPNVENAYSMPSFTGGRPAEAGDRVVYSCMQGTFPEGNTVIVCQPDGTWSDPPVCSNSTTNNGGNGNGNGNNGNGNGEQPSSNNNNGNSGSSCGPAPYVENAQIYPSWTASQRDSRTGDSVTYRCDEGYSRGGYATIYCLATGVWPNAPVCDYDPNAAPSTGSTEPAGRQRAACGPAPVIANAAGVPSFDRGFSYEGDTVTYQCQNGYNPRGSTTIYCSVLGQWSTPPTCDFSNPPATSVIGSCGPAPRLPHASMTTSFGQQQSSVGDTATYTCDAEYILEGPDTIFCVSRGYWSPLPACRDNPSVTTPATTVTPLPEGKPCPEPPYLLDGEYFKGYTGTANPGAIAYYRCNSGFKLTGSDQSVCTDTGIWRSVNGAPYCAKTTDSGTPASGSSGLPAGAGTTGCFPPPEIAHGHAIRYYTVDPPQPGSYVVYECDSPEYQINGTPSIVCQPDMTWTTVPRCLSATPSSITCGDPPQIPNAKADRFYTSSRSQPGDYVAYDCSPGYDLQGVPTSVCQETGDWSRPPVCTLATCGPAPAIVNGLVNAQTFVNPNSRVGDQVKYQCAAGYVKQPDTEAAICENTGTWSNVPHCILPGESIEDETTTVGSTTTPATCGPAPAVTNAVIVPLYTGTMSRIGDSVSYQCQTQHFHMIGYPVAYCLSNGKWSPTPSCQWLPPHHHSGKLPQLPPPAHHHHIPPPPITLTCPMPPAVENGNVLPTKQANFVTYKCFDNYKLIGTPFAVCECTTSDGRCMWTPSPTCQEINDTSTTATSQQPTTTLPPPTCGPAPMISYGSCMLVSPDFDDTIPEMENVTTSTTYHEHDVTLQLAQKGDRAHCQCFSGYDLQGPPNVYCQSDLTWSTAPRCIDQQSARAYRAPPSSTTTVSTSSTTATKAVLAAAAAPASSVAGGCGPAPVVTFGYIVSPFLATASYVGAVASYVCQPGFQLSGPSPVSYCLPNGVWSAPPVCCNPIIPMLSCTIGLIQTTPAITTTTIAATTTPSCNETETTTMPPCDDATTTKAAPCDDETTTTATTAADDCDEPDTTTQPCVPAAEWTAASTKPPCLTTTVTTTPDPCETTTSGAGCEITTEPPPSEFANNCECNGGGAKSCKCGSQQQKQSLAPQKWKTVFPIAWLGRSTPAPPYRQGASGVRAGSLNNNYAGFCCGRPPTINYATPVDLEPVLHDEFVAKAIESKDTLDDPLTRRRMHAVLTGSHALDRKDGPKIYCVGDSISYMCDEGMELTGPAIVSCLMTGRWSMLPSCQPIGGMVARNEVHPQNDDRSPPRDSCGAVPPTVPNAVILDQSFKDRFSRIGDTATFDCETGYRMEGYKTVFCLSHETWSPLPVCERDLPLCSATPPQVPHSKVTINRAPGNAKNEDKTKAKVGDSATYVCDPGFVLDGHPVSYCLANGEWTPPPDCDELACPEPTLEKGTANYDSLAIGSTAFFACDEDYLLAGPVTASCLMNATWTTFPKCTGPIRCKWGGRVPGIDADKGGDASKQTMPDRHQRLPSGSLAIFTSLPLQCSGLIKKWNLFNAAAGNAVIYADIWRFSNSSTAPPSNEDYEVAEQPGEQYVLIGSNRLFVDSPGSQTVVIEAGLQIFANIGDFVGVRYERPGQQQQTQSGAIALIPSPGQQVLVTTSYPPTLMVNTGYSFDATATFKSGIPLLSAVIEDFQELAYGPCVVNKTRCPSNSDCLPRSCAGFGCVCAEGFWPNANRTKCLRAVPLGEECGDDVACIGYNVQCSSEGRCTCWEDWVPAKDGERCVRRLANSVEPQALLNETCSVDSSRSCYFGRFDQECTKDNQDDEYRCHCRNGYRPANAAERRAFPDDGFECRPNGFNLESSSGEGCSNEEGSTGALTSNLKEAERFIEKLVSSNASLMIVLALLGFIAAVGALIVASMIRQHRRAKKIRLVLAAPLQTHALRQKQHPGKHGVIESVSSHPVNRTGQY